MKEILNLHPADIADKLSSMDKTDRNLAFMMLPGQLKANVYTYFELSIQTEIAKSLGDEGLAEVLNHMAPDDRTQLFDNFPDKIIKYCINLLNPEEKNTALNLIGYDKDSMARIMTPLYIQAKQEWTVARTFAHIRKYGKKAETLTYIYIIDDEGKLIDELKIGQLLMADENVLIKDLLDFNFIAIKTTTPIEDGVEIFEKYDRSSLPIITDNGTLVGIVTFDDVLDKIQERDTEDIHKFGGVEGLDYSYTQTPWWQLVRKRAGWLVILFFGEMLTASAMGYYDGEIQKAVVLALFIPLIISSGGNSGSQAASLIIRAMALRELKLKDWFYVMRKELISGLLLGSILGIIGFFRILIWQKAGFYDYGIFWLSVAAAVAVSLIFIVLWGTLSGSLIPFILRKVGLDPAAASAPFVATLVDVTGLIIYFSVAAFFLQGKLL